ncbi:MAG: LamG-like jellyroll fold domain-containing protein, partial [Verrucomicrobiota bacterium]
YAPSYPQHFEDIAYGISPRTLLPSGTNGHAHVPTDGSLALTWTGNPAHEPFDTSSWTSGLTGVGFESGTSSLLAHQEPNLKSYWDFDSKVGSTILDRKAGSPHNGTLAFGADITTGSQGYGGGEALEPNADGNGATDGHLTADNPETYDFNSSFTWHARVKTSGGNGGIISRAPVGANWNQGSKALFMEANRIEWDTGWVGNPNTAVQLTDNLWHQIVVTYNAATDALKIYVDPATISPVAQYDATHNVNSFDEHTHSHNGGMADSDFRVGWVSPNFQNTEFPGLIDDVAVWCTEFPAADVGLLAQDEPIAGNGPFGTLIQTVIPSNTVSVYVRVPFMVDDPTEIDALLLKMKYDDGYVAYLNGVEVAATNAPASPMWNSTATIDRSNLLGTRFETNLITAFTGALNPGLNLLAIHGLNENIASSEMLVLPEIVAMEADI